VTGNPAGKPVGISSQKRNAVGGRKQNPPGVTRLTIVKAARVRRTHRLPTSLNSHRARSGKGITKLLGRERLKGL